MDFNGHDKLPEEFKALVECELANARLRALEMLYPMGKSVRMPPPRRRYRRGCKGCGGPMDDLNPDCVNCKARHGMRKTYRRQHANAN